MKSSQTIGAITILVLQSLLGIAFVGFGVLHGIAPAFIVTNMTMLGLLWMLPLVAMVELVGGIGLLMGLRYPQLGSLAALWCAAIMLGAIMAHLRVSDVAGSLAPLTFLVPALVVAFLRRHHLSNLVQRMSTNGNGHG